MNRATSVESWRQLQGSLGERQRAVHTWLLENPGGRTAAELDKALGPSAHKRLSELERLGLVLTAGNKRCTVTKREAIAWHGCTWMNASARKPKPPRSELVKTLRHLVKLYDGNPFRSIEALTGLKEPPPVAAARELLRQEDAR